MTECLVYSHLPQNDARIVVQLLYLFPNARCIPGHSRPKCRVFVPNLTAKQLEAVESTSADYCTLSKRLFQLVFAQKLDDIPEQICCTRSDGKDLLSQGLLKGIRCKCCFCTYI